MNKNKLSLIAIVFATLFFAMAERTVYADGVSVNVSVDTSALPKIPGSEIVFFLTDGAGTGDANNTAVLGNFMFGGGTAGAVDALNTSGGASGNLSGASLTDSAFTNVFGAFFTAGSQLSFLLNLTANIDAGGTPDQFGFAILDPSGVPIPNTDPTGSGNLLVINLDSAHPTPTSYSNLVTVTPAVVATAEPPAGMLAVTALVALTFFSRKRRTEPRS